MKHRIIPEVKELSAAKWLGVPGRVFVYSNQKEYPAPLFRRSFNMTKPFSDKITVTIAAAGYYELYLNGRKVGDHVLDPTPTIFDKRVYYVTYSLHDLLKEGENTIGVIIGNSTYNCPTGGPWMLDKMPWRDFPKFILQINDSDTPLLASDDNWQCHTDGPIRNDAVKNGEIYDARMELGDWSGNNYDAKNWGIAGKTHAPGGILVEQKHEPCRIFKVFQTKRISSNIYDTGQNFSGWAKIRVRGKRGTSVTLRYSEVLDESGEIDRSGVDYFITTGAFQTDKYILKGEGEEEWEPRFTYHGFRYIRVDISGDAELLSLEACALGTDFKTIGNIETSSKILNQLQNNVYWCYRSNFTGIPTDCPTREKQGWTGDALCAIDVGLYNFDSAAAYIDWLDTVVDSQRPNGQLAAKAPLSSAGYNWGFGPAWDSALFHIPAAIYAHSGILDSIAGHYQAMQKYLDYCSDMSDNHIPHFGLGDWCAPDKVEGFCPVELVTTAYYYSDAELMAKFAALLGKDKDSSYYRELAEKIKDAFIERFHNGDGTFADKSMTSFAMPVAFGLAPNPELSTKLLNNLVIEQKHTAQFGIQGAKFVPRVLAEYGYADTACRIFTQGEYPGWAYQLKLGATTCWEHWKDEESRNHIMYGDVSAWLFCYPGGFRFDLNDPGRAVMKPVFLNDLQFFNASLNGIISSWRKKESGGFEYNLDVPDGNTIELYLPTFRSIQILSSGKHRFDLDV